MSWIAGGDGIAVGCRECTAYLSVDAWGRGADSPPALMAADRGYFIGEAEAFRSGATSSVWLLAFSLPAAERCHGGRGPHCGARFSRQETASASFPSMRRADQLRSARRGMFAVRNTTDAPQVVEQLAKFDMQVRASI